MSVDHRGQRLYEALDSSAWGIVVDDLLRNIRAWTKELLTVAEIDESRRRGLVYARTALLAGIERVYTKAGRELPPALRQEMHVYSGEEL
ncbi:MAG: hypothetical protein KGL39_08980 [Patescibacteria group bacterium]|nr:hypothetical protein [Patescibacteria group bacterium]